MVGQVCETWRQRYVLASLVLLGQLHILWNVTSLRHLTTWLIELAAAVPVSRAMGTQREVEPLRRLASPAPNHPAV